MISKKSLIISTAIHLVLVGFIVWGALVFEPVQFGTPGPSGGGVVEVWIENGAPGPLGPWAPRQMSEVKTIPHAHRSQAAHTSVGASGNGTGTGSGTGGNGDDPRLTHIRKRINDSKYYPKIAREGGVEGAPRIRFAIGEDGGIKEVGIAFSSGEAILDDAAIEAVRRAAPLPYYPGPITVTLKFSLK